MVCSVSPRPNTIEERDIKSGRAVRSLTIVDCGELANHLLGRGRVLVPCTRIFGGSTSYSTSTEYIWRFRAQTSAQAVQREWIFSFDDYSSDGGVIHGADATYTIKVPHSGSAITHRVSRGTHSTLSIIEPLGSQASADTELTCAISASAVQSALVVGGNPWGGNAVSVAVYETPRLTLVADATDLGVDTAALRTGQPIASASVGTLALAAASVTVPGRGGVFHWAVPATAGTAVGVTTTSYARSSTSSSYAPLLDSGVGGTGVSPLGIPVLLPKWYRNGVSNTLRIRPYGWVSAGTAVLEVRATTSRSGSTSSSVTTSSTSPTWLSAFDITVDAEDLSTADGLQSGTLDLLQVEFRRTGTGTAYIAGVSCFQV